MQADELEASYLDVPATPCLAEVDACGWATTVAVRAGRFVLGVRTNTEAGAEVVSRLFDDRLLEGARPPANLSLWLAPDADGAVGGLHRTYLAHVRMERGRSARRAIDTVWHELDGVDAMAEGRRVFDLTVLVRDGRAHLFPGWLRVAVIDDQRRWERAGFVVLERRWIEVDLASHEVLVPAPVSVQRRDEMASSLAAAEIEIGDDRALHGRIPIASWNVASGAGDAERLGAVVGDLRVGTSEVTAATVRELAVHLGELPSLGVDLEPLGLVNRVERAVSGPSESRSVDG